MHAFGAGLAGPPLPSSSPACSPPIIFPEPATHIARISDSHRRVMESKELAEFNTLPTKTTDTHPFSTSTM